MTDRFVRLAVGFGVALAALYGAGFFAPSVFTWGVHVFGFLPKSLFALYLLLAALGIWAAAGGRFEEPLRRLGDAVERHPRLLWAAAFFALIVLAFLFRVKAPLLGDSFIAVKLYENRLVSTVFSPTAHEFLSFCYFYAVMKLTGLTAFPSIMDAFLVGELLLGALFVAAAIATVRLTVTDAATRGAAFLLAALLPYLQLFFGYVENYAFVLTMLSLYTLTAALFLRGRFPFALLPAVYAVVVLAHYLNAPLGLSLFYLGYREYRERGWKNIGLGAAVVAACGLLAWIIAGTGLRELIPPERHSPFLSAAQIANVYQAYTLFSPIHGIDLANLALLVAAAPLFAVALALVASGRAPFATPFARFLLLAAAPMVVVFFLLQFDLPLAVDWDIPAPYAYFLALLAAVAAFPALGAARVRAASVLLVTVVLGSLAWWTFNASVRPAIARATLFLDPRISSPDGCYQSALHLTEWYVRNGDRQGMEEISEKFIGMYPDDPRGYANYTLYLMEYGPSMDAKIREIFDRWLARDSSSAAARIQYAHFELDVGQRAYRDGKPLAAIGHLERAITLDSTLSDAANSLGLAYKALGNTDSASAWYRRTILLDPVDVSAYINLGNLSDDLGNSAGAIGWYEKALAVQPNSPAALYNLGITYAKINDSSRAAVALRSAARLGMADAQQYLRERGMAW